MVNGLNTGTIEALEADFYERGTVTVAKDLLGKIIVRAVEHGANTGKRDLRLARIVETEAYAPDDPASHAFRGPTERNRVMFGAPGHAYVYFIYGMHHCLNAVTEPEGTGGAVLIRAATPLYGLTAMWHSRFPSAPPAEPLDGRAVRKLAGGPAMLTQALFVRTNEDNGVPLYEGSLQIARHVKFENDGEELEFAAPAALEIISDERVGISRAAEKPWRFTVAESPFLSRKPSPASRSFRYRPQ